MCQCQCKWEAATQKINEGSDNEKKEEAVEAYEAKVDRCEICDFTSDHKNGLEREESIQF